MHHDCDPQLEGAPWNAAPWWEGRRHDGHRRLLSEASCAGLLLSSSAATGSASSDSLRKSLLLSLAWSDMPSA